MAGGTVEGISLVAGILRRRMTPCIILNLYVHYSIHFSLSLFGWALLSSSSPPSRGDGIN